ncbi:accessory Sec system glycosyltransferase GtfA [Limosilactobacillus sp.]|uniref:accessory Sec system glycosyltransferase GtfA n=1 Tax=Limosilactobacillus sp. TaxID=2773925 RepID=UPI00345ED108
MTIYNVNLGIGWASSGVEYAQAYRAQSLRQNKMDAKFIFSDLILANNIEAMTKNLGFTDDQIIWFYNFFTDVKIAPSTYSLKQLEQDLNLGQHHVDKKFDRGDETVYQLSDEQLEVAVRMVNRDKQTLDQVSYVVNGVMVKRDFYSYTKYASEYYNGDKNNNHVTFREFYNENGQVAYTEYLNDNNGETFEFPDHQIFYSKNELYLEMIKRLNFQDGDVIILDRMDESKGLNNGQLIFEHHNPAKLMVVVHADHYDKHYTDEHHILWNNFYEYQFTHTADVASFVVATDAQRDLLLKQQKHYYDLQPRVDTIPVGSLDQLRRPKDKRKSHSLITASRLASEKHIDWLIKAVASAHKQVADVTLDIYGQGSEQGHLQQLISQFNAGSYIHLMGQHDLTDVYTKYDAYIAASTSEGFGLSLLEAVGSGLPMIGFDVPYGNQTFIDDGQNGYRLPYVEDWSDQKKVDVLSQATVKLFTEADLKQFSQHSYNLAEPYLTDNVAKRWSQVLGEIENA